MSSPKGKSKHPQSAMYKDGECKVVEQSDVEDHMADGWCDNPDETSVAEEVTEDDSEPEIVEANEEPEPEEGKTIMGTIKGLVGGGTPDETPEEGSTPEPEG